MRVQLKPPYLLSIAVRPLGWRKVVGICLPVMLAYFSVACAYGVSAAGVGLSWLETMAMSLFVFAGSAQLVAVGMIATHQSPLAIILTVFIVNARHILFGAALTPYVQNWPRLQQWLLAVEMTDESFALHARDFGAGRVEFGRVVSINTLCHFSWLAGSGFGHIAHDVLPNIEKIGMDFALPAMFVALLVLQIRSARQVIVAMVGGTLGVLFQMGHWGSAALLAATVIGATLGLGIEVWKRKH